VLKVCWSFLKVDRRVRKGVGGPFSISPRSMLVEPDLSFGGFTLAVDASEDASPL
jgi:hypothetical protein